MIFQTTTASERAKPASEPRRFDPAGLRVGDPEPRIRIEAGRLVECSHSVCPGVNFGEDVVAFVGGDSEVFSGEAEVVDFAGGVVDFEADVPAVFCGVAVCGGVRSVRLGDCGCCEEFCDDVVVCGAGGGGDDDGSEGFAEGVGVFDGCFVVFACGADAGDGFACGHVVGCSKRVVFAFEVGDGVVEGLCVGDGCGVGAFCTFYDTGGGEVKRHGGDSPVLVFGADLPGVRAGVMWC